MDNGTKKDAKYQQAICSYDKALEQRSDLWEALYEQGNIYSYLGEYEEAIKHYNEAETWYHNNADFFLNRGKAYHLLGKLDEAVKDLRKAREMDPQKMVAYVELAFTFLKKRKWESAKKAMNDLKEVMDDLKKRKSREDLINSNMAEDIERELKKLWAAYYCERCKVYITDGNENGVKECITFLQDNKENASLKASRTFVGEKKSESSQEMLSLIQNSDN